MPLPPDTRPPAPLPPDLLPLTSWDTVESAAAEAVRRFTTPPAITRRITDPVQRIVMPKFLPQDFVHRDVEGTEGRIGTWTWGDPAWPRVVCIHGWGGRGTQWSGLVHALLAVRHRVTIFDAPAHGASDGDRASLPAFRNALLAVLGAEDTPAHALVGHSLGGLSVIAAIAELANTEQLPLPQRAVSIGAPSSVDRPMARFLKRHEASPAVHAEMIAQLEARWNFRWQDMHTPALAEQAMRAGGAPLLVIHADDDEQVPAIEGVGLSADWPRATHWVAPHGTGHVRVLRDDAVIQRIVAWVTDADSISDET